MSGPAASASLAFEAACAQSASQARGVWGLADGGGGSDARTVVKGRTRGLTDGDPVSAARWRPYVGESYIPM